MQPLWGLAWHLPVNSPLSPGTLPHHHSKHPLPWSPSIIFSIKAQGISLL